MTDTRLTRPESAGGRRHPKHARRPERDFRWPRPSGGPPDLQPPTTPPDLGPRDYRLRGLDLGPGSPPAPAPAPAPAAGTRSAADRRRTRARQRRKRWLLVVAAVVGSVVLVAVLLRLTLIEPFTVPSSAMAPTLQPGDKILVLRSSFITGSIGRGDIIVFHRPKFFPCQSSGTGQYLVQRVIGLPGETISSNQQTIYIDGKQIAERGWYDPGHGAVGSKQIPRTTIPEGTTSCWPTIAAIHATRGLSAPYPGPRHSARSLP